MADGFPAPEIPISPDERFRLYRLCPCDGCNGSGKTEAPESPREIVRCPDCRGEGRVRQLVAAAADAQGVGVALVTLGREGEWDGCAFGLLDCEGETGERWLLKPWLPSPRNVSEAGRVLAKSKGER